MDDTNVEIAEFTKKGFCTLKDRPGNILAAIPGEKGTVKKVFGKGKRSLYLLETLLEKSNDRVEARCKHFTACGGCSLQHVSYARQLQEKEGKVKNLFSDHQVAPIVGMDDPWRYRGKMEFTFSQNKAGEKFLGLIKPKSRGFVENLTECHITHEWYLEMLTKVRTYWMNSEMEAYNFNSNTGSLQTLTLRKATHTESKMVILTVSGNADFALSKEQLNGFITAIDEEDCAVFLQIKCISKGTPTRFYEMHLSGPAYFEEKILDRTFRMSPKAFFQPNPKMAEKFFTAIKESLQLTGKEKILDLFSGIGTISTLLSAHAEHIVAVEIGKEAVCDARENIERLGIDNIEMYADDVANFIETRGEHFIPDIVVIDPPRIGMGKVAIDFLEKLKPSKIAYLSCNPVTQKEDIEKLPSYQISSIRPFDQFPHTPHLENLIILELR
ncbi:MAG: 23S rRNA (uracil-C(5))-methyltransferase RlmCD [Chlamydiia bacterium]|nr:23S rRNA (uracil-C(5))-methyltransferase RlmCD [Chlamydiia bacterium]MCH9619060.1 23S rRNA (uracil-C(5))-methyltransferase RlmCD [Chlamydiia bacterium]